MHVCVADFQMTPQFGFGAFPSLFSLGLALLFFLFADPKSL